MNTITEHRMSSSMAIGGLVELTRQLSSKQGWQQNIERSLEIVCDVLRSDVAALGLRINDWQAICWPESRRDEIEPILLDHCEVLLDEEAYPLLGLVDEAGENYLSLPVRCGGSAFGIIHVSRDREESFDTDDMEVLSLVATVIGSSLKVESQSAKLEKTLQDSTSFKWDFDRTQALLDNLSANSQLHLAYLDTDFNILWVNDAYASDYGFKVEDMLGRNYFETVRNDGHRSLFEQVLSSGFTYEAREQPSVSARESGRAVTYWNGSISCVKDSDGVVQGLVLSMTDLTDEVRARQEIAGLRVEAERRAEELAASEQRVVNIIESISDGFIALDTDWRFTFVNQEAERLLKRSRHELLGTRVWESDPRLDGSRFHEACLKAMTEHLVVTVEDHLPWLDGWFEHRISPSSEGLLISLRDITERRQAEEERCRYLSSLGQMVGVSADVLAETTVQGLLGRVLDAAMELTDAGIGMAAFGKGEDAVHLRRASQSLPEAAEIAEIGSGWMNEACHELLPGDQPIRLTRQDLNKHASLVWLPHGHPPLDGLLAAPLSGYENESTGMIAVSKKIDGDFTSEDEALLSQLAMIGSLGLQHIEARDNAEKRAEEAEEGRRILDALIEHVPEGIVIADGPDLKVRMASRYVRETTGCTNETWDNPGLFRSLWSLYRLDGVTAAEPHELPLTRAVHKGEVITSEEWMFYRADGEPVTILCNAGPIKDREGNVAGGVVAWRDIGLLRSARESLKNDLELNRHIANTLQNSLITNVQVDLDNLSVGARYKPAFREFEVGGDFYDVFDVDGGKLALVMGDVSGKGLEAAVHTAAAKYMLRAYAHENPEPSYVLTRLNDALCAYTPECLFVTIFFGVLDLKTRQLVYSSAGHDEPLHYIDKLRTVEPLDVTGRAVGIIPQSQYSQRVLQLDDRDILLIYTDGVSDARSQGRFFGVEGLTEVLIANAHCDEQTIADVVLASASEFGGGGLKDDAAILVVKAKSGVA